VAVVDGGVVSACGRARVGPAWTARRRCLSTCSGLLSSPARWPARPQTVPAVGRLASKAAPVVVGLRPAGSPTRRPHPISGVSAAIASSITSSIRSVAWSRPRAGPGYWWFQRGEFPCTSIIFRAVPSSPSNRRTLGDLVEAEVAGEDGAGCLFQRVGTPDVAAAALELRRVAACSSVRLVGLFSKAQRAPLNCLVACGSPPWRSSFQALRRSTSRAFDEFDGVKLIYADDRLWGVAFAAFALGEGRSHVHVTASICAIK